MLKIRRVVSLVCGTETQEKGIIFFLKLKIKIRLALKIWFEL